MMKKEVKRESFSPPNTENVDQLFETHSVAEISEIVAKLEKEIERKRSDLRQIVGEMYKELVEVSDSLQVMNDRCNYILESVDHLDELTQKARYQRATFCDRRRLSERESKEEWLIAFKARAIIKAPSLIWASVDKGDILSATFLHAQALHFWDSLKNIDFPGRNSVFQYSDLVQSLNYSLVRNIWDSMKFTLEEEKDSEKVSLNLICASYLQQLEPGDLLKRFLLDRRNQVSALDSSHLDLSETFRFHLGSILETFRIVFTVFMEDNGVPSLLQRTSLYFRRFKVNQQTIQSQSHFPHFTPREISNFCLKLEHINEDLPATEVMEMCNNWATEMREEVTLKTRKALERVERIDSIFSVLKEVEKLTNDPDRMLNWQDLNEILFQGTIPVWAFYLKDVVIAYVRLLITSRMEKSFSALLNKVTASLTQISHQSALDLVWNEESTTPADLIKKSYRIYDDNLRILSEFEEECGLIEEQLSVLKSKDSKSDLTIVPEADINELREHFNDSFKNNVKGLLSSLNHSFDRNDSYCLLGLVDFCRTLIFASPKFKKCHFFLGKKDLWPESRSLLRKSYSAAVSEYLESNLTNLAQTFREEMKVTPLINLLNICSTWNEITLEEVSESGKTMQTSSRVPIQISSPLFRFLNAMNEATNQVSAHTMSPSILASLLKPLIVQLKEIYGQLLEEIINYKDSPRSGKQTQILQFLFDISFLRSVVKMMREDSLREELITFLVKLEHEYRSQIDPVDLHVLEPHIETALLKCLATNFLLFGSLFVEQSKASARSTKITGSSKSDAKFEPHILMPSYSFESTFPLLPLKKGG